LDWIVINPALARQIVENATDYAIFTLDADGLITSWSPGAERILGYSEQEALGMDFRLLFLEADRAASTPSAELDRALKIGRAEDTRWHVRKDGQRFWANGVTMRLQDEPGLLKVMRDETPSKVAEDQRVLLLNELNHRLKNTLVTVQSIVDHTLRSEQASPATRRVLTERLIALSEAHDVLVEQNWAGADLQVIVERAISPYEHGEPRFEVDGPAVRLSPQQAVSMSLALHELCTNAIKYGALSAVGGKVSISWNIEYGGDGARAMTLLWRESGGPPVTPPTRKGFGTRLIGRSFGAENHGRAHLEYAAEGLTCIIQMALTGPDGAPMLPVHGDPADRR
jgi:PAS domain S-box-containing protein